MNESGLSTSTVFSDTKSNTGYNIIVTAFNEAGNISDTILNVGMSLDTTKGLLHLEGFIYIRMYLCCRIRMLYVHSLTYKQINNNMP